MAEPNGVGVEKIKPPVVVNKMSGILFILFVHLTCTSEFNQV